MGMHSPEAAERFDGIAREVFAPLYPVMAERILGESGLESGRCLDLGCGSGWLGIAVARQSDLDVTFLDASEAMLDIAGGHLETSGLRERAALLCGDVHNIPLPDCSVDLAVSRGSFPFWEEPERAVKEILRVLKPGGHAFVGGGFGNAAIKKEIFRKMRERDPQWQERVKTMGRASAMARLVEGVMALEASEVCITRDERGFMARFVR